MDKERPIILVSDWDGVFFDSREVSDKANAAIFRTFGIEPPGPSVWRDRMTANYMEFFWEHGIPRSVAPDEIDRVWRDVIETHWKDSKLYPGSRQLLKRAQSLDVRTAIVSSTADDILSRRFTEFELKNLVDRHRGRAYDRKQAIAETLAHFELEPQDAWYMDDTSEGLAAAKDLGIHTIGLTHGYNSEEKIRAGEPDFIASNLWMVNLQLTKASPRRSLTGRFG